jgi:hypothetical protein
MALGACQTYGRAAQAAKIAPFAAGNEGVVRKIAAGEFFQSAEDTGSSQR